MDCRVLEPRVIEQNSVRDWLRVVLLQPVDTKTKYVQVPVVKTVDRYVPKITYEEKIVEVPRSVHKTVHKVVEKPYVKYVDKYEEVPEIRYTYTYVPKETIQERTIYKAKPVTVEKVEYKERPQIKYVDRYVEVPCYQEVVRFEPAPLMPLPQQDHGGQSAEREQNRCTCQIPTDEKNLVR